MVDFRITRDLLSTEAKIYIFRNMYVYVYVEHVTRWDKWFKQELSTIIFFFYIYIGLEKLAETFPINPNSRFVVQNDRIV